MSPEQAAERLSDHLDAVVMGEATRAHDLDPSLAAAVARFFAADDAPPPPPGLGEHLWEDLMDHTATVPLVPAAPSFPANRNGRSGLRSMPAPLARRGPSRSHWAIAQMATAALVLLTLIGSVAAFRGSTRLPSLDQQPVIISAINNVPERTLPPGVIGDDVLLRATVGQLPPSVRSPWLGLERIQLAPGALEPAGSQADTGVGPNLFTVESGQVTVEADATVLLTRAGADQGTAPSSVPPGANILLDVGDQLYAPSGATFRRRNDGLTPATILNFWIGSIGDIFGSFGRPPGVTYDPGFPNKGSGTFPAVPAEATVHRLTLAPGAELAVRDLPGLELLYVEAGVLDLVYAQGEIFGGAPERSFTIRAGSGTETFGGTPEQAVLANRGAEPLVILTAAVIPAIASTPERTPSPGVVADDVLVHAIVEQLQPSERTLTFGLNRVELAPGAVEATGSEADNGVSADVFLVESGEVTVEADGPVFVTRAAEGPLSAPSRIEPGTAITLAVGDQIYAPSGVTTRRRNDGPTPAVMFGAGLGSVGDTAYEWSDPPGVTYAHGLPFRLLEALPTTPVAVTVRRQTIAPGGEIAVRDQPGLELVYVEQGALSLVYAKPETPATPERSFTIRAGSGTETFGRTPEQAVLANRGAELLVILTASVVPAIDGVPESASPSGVIADHILLSATIEEMPEGRSHRLSLRRIRLAPGAADLVGSKADTGVGPDLFTVETGQVTVEADAPVFLARRVANPAAVSSPVQQGATVVLDVGDQLYAPSGVSFRRRNDELTQAAILDFSVGTVGGRIHTMSLPAGVTADPGLPFKLPFTYPNVPAEATVRRLTIAPGTELAIRDLPGLELVYVEAGALSLVYAKEESPATPERVFTIRAGSGTETFGRTPEQALLANRGAEPLVILTASVVPANDGEATPQAP